MKSQNIFLVGFLIQTILAFLLGFAVMYGIDLYGHPVMLVLVIPLAINAFYFSYWFTYNFGVTNTETPKPSPAKPW